MTTSTTTATTRNSLPNVKPYVIRCSSNLPEDGAPKGVRVGAYSSISEPRK